MIAVYSIGHSTRTWPGFLSLLAQNDIRLVADVRRYPYSRKFPHFNRDELEARLHSEGIGYSWMEALGGWRRKSVTGESPNSGLRSESFRNYADYMLTREFQAAAQQLLEAAALKATAILCAEGLYWKCHRRLLCDYLASRKVQVIHIEDEGKLSSHRLTPGAVLTPDGVAYPGDLPQ